MVRLRNAKQNGELTGVHVLMVLNSTIEGREMRIQSCGGDRSIPLHPSTATRTHPPTNGMHACIRPSSQHLTTNASSSSSKLQAAERTAISTFGIPAPVVVPQALVSRHRQQQLAPAARAHVTASKHYFQQHQHQRQQQRQLHPDPAADDLDLLAAAAAAAPPTNNPAPAAAAAAAARTATTPQATITSIPDAEPRYVLPAGRQPRYTAADKLQLSGAEMRDIGWRLRTPLRGAQGRLLRVFRYGVDDLRLYQAIDLAGLEGRVVVVDSSSEADAVLTTFSKRTRKNVNLATARRIAEGAKVPLLVLPAMSAQRLVEAVGPILQLPTVQEGQDGAPVGSGGVMGYEPRLLRWDELEGDGSEELLQLMWGNNTADGSSSAVAAAPGDPAAGTGARGGMRPSPRWQAWCAAQATSPPALSGELFAAIRDADVEDAREGAVPANPTARAGERHRLLKPCRPRSRIKRRQLRQDLAARDVEW